MNGMSNTSTENGVKRGSAILHGPEFQEPDRPGVRIDLEVAGEAAVREGKRVGLRDEVPGHADLRLKIPKGIRPKVGDPPEFGHRNERRACLPGPTPGPSGFQVVARMIN